jgi:hypothetical protein
MMNDPLLNPHIETPPAAPAARTARTSTRKKHPAISARILAVGLSTTALIGLTTGYTLSQKVSAVQPVASSNNVVKTSLQKTVDADVSAPTSQVVFVPVPGASAATAGTPSVQVQAPAPAATTQKSSGSN